MNSNTKRKITATVVSLMLVAVIAVTGVLCAVNFNKDKGGNISTDNLASETYNPYNDYGMQKVTREEAAYKYVYASASGSNDAGGIAIQFPTQIYMDYNETLVNAGYYYHIWAKYWSCNKGYGSRGILMSNTVIGLYNGTTSYGATGNALTMTNFFSDYGMEKADDFVNCSIDGALGGLNDGTAKNNATRIKPSSIDNPNFNLYLKGTPQKIGSGTFDMPTAERVFWLQWYGTTATSWSNQWRDTANNLNNFTNSLVSGQEPNFDSDIAMFDKNYISINVTVYNKADLYDAYKNLKASKEDLSNLATSESLQAAQNLIDEAQALLKTRITNQNAIDTLKNKLNAFVFDIERPHTTYLDWTFGDANHADGSNTKLEVIWDKYNENLAKYFNVSIVNTIYDQFKSGVVEDTQTRTVTNAATYRSDGYVRDAGSYEITFTARSDAANSSEINHGVQWLTDTDNKDAKITLTINRANMVVKPATVANRTYSGIAQAYQMSTSGAVVSLKGGMISTDASSKIVVKLSKTYLAADGALEWDDCENSISFTEVGTHKVYFRIQAKNHNAQKGEYTVTITPASVTITMGTAAINKNSSGGVLTYGDAVLSSENIISQGVTGVSMNSDANNSIVNKTTLPNILSLGLYDNNAFVDNNLTNAGNHEVRVREYKAVTQTTEERAENPLITKWDQRINVTVQNGAAAYSIAKKEINIDWSGLRESIYNAQGGHRPTANVRDGELVEGGEQLRYSTYVLSGAEVGLPEGMAGIVEFEGEEYQVPITEGGNAVWAGKYKVGIKIDNPERSNYTISEDTATTDFEILKRKLHIIVKDQVSDYAHAMNQQRENAETVRDVYQNDMFNSNASTNFSVYEYGYVDGEITSLPITGNEGNIFKVDIVDVPTTDPNHGSPDSFYKAGVYEGALIAKLREEGDTNNEGMPLEFDRIRSFDFTYEAGKFTVNKADIGSDRVSVRKTFNGAEQDFALKVDPLTLTGYESIHRAEDGVITIEYSESLADFDSTCSTNPIKLRNHNNGKATTIYYRISAENHNTTKILNFSAYIDRLGIEVIVGNQSVTYYYGDEIPDSEHIDSALNLEYRITRGAQDDDVDAAEFKLEDNLKYYIFKFKGGIEVTDRKQGADLYSIGLKPLTDQNSLDNYDISYSGRGYEQVFEISPRPLIVDWRQSGSNWIDDGLHFVYNATTPNIQPTVRAFRNADLSSYNDKSTGANTSDDQNDGWVENFVEGDTIALRPQTLKGSTYKVDGYETDMTTLSKTENIQNYVLVNPSATYYIVKRTVGINVFDQTATYGSAKSVALGRLVSSTAAGAKWEYNSATPYQFIRDHYMNWQLSSEAIEGSATDYKNVGTYAIAFEESAGNDGSIAGNYEIIVYRKHANGTVDAEPATSFADVAKFDITTANLNIARREFNFDASPIDPDNSSSALKETCDMDIEDIREIIRVVGGTKGSDLTITMSDAISGNVAKDATFPAGTDMSADRHIQLNNTSHIGRYHVWVHVTNSNYEDLYVAVDINYLTNWISILLGDQITVNYGDTVMSSDELFNTLNVLSITGVMDDDGATQITDAKTAWQTIQNRDYFSLFVGRGDKSALERNESVGNYSVFMDIKKENVGSGNDELHFRFVGNTIGSGATSNVDVYKVIERPVYLVWKTNVNETYGNHNDGSDSHTGYTVMNVLDTDDVKVDIIYEANDAYGNPGEKKGNHVHYVGDYIATLSGVSHHNYRIAVVGDRIPQEDGSTLTITRSHLEKEFSINEREITVTIKDQTLVYGSLDARENADSTSNNNIYNFVNASTAYYVSEGSIYDEDLASDIFNLQVRYTLAEGCNYLGVDTYLIFGTLRNTKIAKNYNVRFARENGAENERNAQLTITNATLTIDSNKFPTIYFDGNEHCPLDKPEDALSFSFKGDREFVSSNRRIYFNQNVNAQANDSGWVLVRDGNDLRRNFTFRNAGEYTFAIKVEVPNHDIRIRNDITFEILPVDVKINMTSQAKKTYGDVIGDGSEKAISDFIKAGTNVTYTVTANGQPWNNISNVANAFIFYVVAGGEEGADSGAGVEVGNFANDVGEYRVYHKFAKGEEGNYNVTYTEVNNVGCHARAYKINPRTVDIIWYTDTEEVAPHEFTYTGHGVPLKAKFKAIRYNADTKELEEYDYTDLILSGIGYTEAGETVYTANISGNLMRSVIDNYDFNPATSSFEYKIVPRNVVVRLKNQGNVYGDAVNFGSNAEWWYVVDDTLTGLPLGDNGMVLTLNIPQLEAGKSLPCGTYEIKAVYNNTNYKVTFADDEGIVGWGKYTVTEAEIDRAVSQMTGFVYNGAEQDVNIYEFIGEDVANRIFSISGDMTWAQAKVYYKSGDNWVETLPTVMNVGTTEVEYKVCLDNHEDFISTMEVTVAKATIIFNADIFEIQYGETALESDELFEKLNVRVNTQVGNALAVDLKDLIRLSISDLAIGVDHYRLQVEILGDLGDNFEVKNQFAEEKDDPTALPYHIVPRVITVNWGDTDRVYNAGEQYFSAVDFNNVMAGESISAPTYSILVEGSEQIAKGKDVGEYVVKIIVNGSNRNYIVDEDSRYQTFTIKPKEVDVEWNEDSFVYDGEGHMLTASIVGGIYRGDTCAIVEYSPNMVNAGTHTAKVVGLSNENYTVPESATKEFTIEAKEVIIVWEIENFIYNGSEQCLKAHVSANSLIGADTCEVVVSGGGINAGTHRAIVTGLKNSNYKLPYGGAGQEYAIAPRTIKSINWSNTTLTYEENNGVGVAQVPTATVGDGMVEGDNVEFEIFVAQGEAINVGSYTATIVGVKGGNYIIDASVTNRSSDFQIQKAQNSLDNNLTLPNKDGGLPALADFESVSSKYGNAIVKYYRDGVEYTGNLNDAPKGTYDVVVMVEGTQNYDQVSRSFQVEVEGSSNAGLIVGITVPIAVLAIAAIVLAIILVKKKKGKKDTTQA